MSGKVTGAVLRADIPAGTMRDVLLAFADVADQYGMDSHPKLATVAGLSGHSVSTVKRYRATLENMGVLIKTATGKNVGGRQTSNVYKVDLSTIPAKQGFTIDGPLVGEQQSKTGGAGVHHGWTGQGSTSVPSDGVLTVFERPLERPGSFEEQQRPNRQTQLLAEKWQREGRCPRCGRFGGHFRWCGVDDLAVMLDGDPGSTIAQGEPEEATTP